MKKEMIHFIKVADNFYKEPELVRDYARSLHYHEIADSTGFRSGKLYKPAGIKSRIEKILSTKITDWDDSSTWENGIFYLAFSGGAQKEQPAIHTDPEMNDITALIYLTPGIPAQCGTTFWQHKKTGLTSEPDAADARKLKMPVATLREIFEEDSLYRSRWVALDRVAYKYNRVVIFPSGSFHSASKHFGKSVKEGRIIQTYRFGIDWKEFKKNHSF